MPNESKVTEEQASPETKEDASEAPGSTSLSGPRPLTAKDLPAGTMIDGKYRIESLLGQGGMGVVMAAEHLALRERVALKFLRVDDETGQAGFRSRFRREAQICAKIKNEHITRVIDVGTYQDAEYMVMEHLDGTDLRGFIRSRRTEALTPEEAVSIAVQVCDGLAEVHARNIVHRDLKPSNLFIVRRSDGSPLVKILDFGISKWGADLDASEEELTKTGAVLGSPKYMAPEQLFGSHAVDARADVWSVGAITYELLTGKPPFEEPTFARLCARLAAAEPPRRAKELRPDLSDELDAAVMLCLERNLTERIPNVAQLAGELLHAIGDPTAEVVRTRLLATLAGGTQTGEVATASVRSGEWVRASMSLSRTGSNPSGKLSITGTNPAHSAAPATIPAPAPEEQKSKKGLYIGLALLALIAIFAFTKMSSQSNDSKAGAGPAPTAAPTPTPSATQTATAAVEPSNTNTATATAATTATAEPPPTATATNAAAAKPVHTAKKPTGGSPAATPTPTPTVTAAPPPPPPPTATTPPTATKPVNPLEDRQ